MVVRTLHKYFPCDLAIRSLHDDMTAITLIEDDARIRQALSAALTERGHVLRAAATAMEGLQLVVPIRPISSFWTSGCRTWTAASCCA